MADNLKLLQNNDSLSGTVDEQMIYCFTIYDLNDDGYIRFDFLILKPCSLKGYVARRR